MTEKQFPMILSHCIVINSKKELTKEEIIEQMMNQEPLISDEEAFLRHLIRKWSE